MAKAAKHFQLHCGSCIFHGKEPWMPLFLERKAGRGGPSSTPGRHRCWEEQPGERRLNSKDWFINPVQFLAAAPASCCTRQVWAGRLGAMGTGGDSQGMMPELTWFVAENLGWRRKRESKLLTHFHGFIKWEYNCLELKSFSTCNKDLRSCLAKEQSLQWFPISAWRVTS